MPKATPSRKEQYTKAFVAQSKIIDFHLGGDLKFSNNAFNKKMTLLGKTNKRSDLRFTMNIETPYSKSTLKTEVPK
jgi:hypothetical protein